MIDTEPKIEVVRKLCANCHKTFSLLPDFLEAGKRFAREVAEEYVAALFFEDCTYRDIAWSSADGEREDASASLSRVCRAVAKAADTAPAMLLAVQQELLLRGEALEEYECEFRQCRVVRVARTSQKARQLEVLKVILSMLEKKMGQSRQAIYMGYRNLGLGFRFPTPHAMRHQRMHFRYGLEGLTMKQTREYVRHHLTLVGCSKEIFTDGAYSQLFHSSGGILREINTLCMEAMLEASNRGFEKVDEKLMKLVIDQRESS